MTSAIWHPSPNCGPRRDGLAPSLIVVHFTAMNNAQSALARLCDPAAEVSAHYLIGADGTLWHLVEEEARAWHAGAGSWAGQADINSRSIGIELDNQGDHAFSAPQMDRLETLISGIMERGAIPARGVIGHSDMAPDRKQDPGPKFDWARLAKEGLAAKAQKLPVERPDRDRFRADARALGYPDASDRALLTAVRARHRPYADGPLQAEDMGIFWPPI